MPNWAIASPEAPMVNPIAAAAIVGKLDRARDILIFLLVGCAAPFGLCFRRREYAQILRPVWRNGVDHPGHVFRGDLGRDCDGFAPCHSVAGECRAPQRLGFCTPTEA